jgi:hypothetical protein
MFRTDRACRRCYNALQLKNIWEVPGSNLDWDKGNPDKPFQANTGRVPQLNHDNLLSKKS